MVVVRYLNKAGNILNNFLTGHPKHGFLKIDGKSCKTSGHAKWWIRFGGNLSPVG